ncbi:MAG: sensor histidine kinase [Bacteroides sp.]
MKRFEKWFWIVPLFVTIIVMAGIRLVTDTPNGYKFWERPISQNLIEWIGAIIIAYLFQAFICYLLKRNEKYTDKLNLKRLLTEYLIIIFVGLLVINPCVVIIHHLIGDPVNLDDLVIASIIFVLVLIFIYSFYRGSQILDAYVEQRVQNEKVKSIQAETELKYLKAQFRPHFLFNALNTIYFQIDEENEPPRRTIEKLSELLRYQLYDVNNSVTVEREFQFIETYMEVQKLRMKDSLKLETLFDPELKPYHIQSLLLLPLVENAFKYVGGDYWIRIEARLKKGNRLALEVRNSIPENTTSNTKKGIGLENLQRQLELLYAGKHKLQCIKSDGTYVAYMEVELAK